MRYVSGWINCLIFLHGLLTAPLLVECISPDGRNLIELLGQDPCHYRHISGPPAVPQNFQNSAVSRTGDATDPCVDLFLNNLDGMSDCPGNTLSPPQAPVDLDQPDESVNIAANPDHRDTGRAAPLPLPHIPTPHLILRI